jgi:hypothetical protein
MSRDLLDDILSPMPEPTSGLVWAEDPLILRLTDDDRVKLQQLQGLLKKDSVDDVLLELIRRAVPSPNGHVGYEVACFGCGKKFHVTRRPAPGRHSWCEDCKTNGEPAAQRAREYRDRKGKEKAQ